jgi:YD repeat-containing protein
VPIASAWLDVVVGIDFHVEVVPTPVPTPTPFPHPHCSVIWDPVGYVVGEVMGAAMAFATGGPIAPAGPVLIGGRMSTVTGDAASMPVKHIIIPPGTTFALGITPSDAELLVGSKTVIVRGGSAVRAGDPGLTCSEPVRLPTGLVTATGPGNVLVGGPPAIDFGAAVGMIGGKALRNKWTAGKLHAIADKVIPESMPRLRRLAHKSACFFTGHPVNVATGGVSTSAVDFELPGPIPLKLERDYDTNWLDRDGPLGHGWSHSLDGRLWLEPGKVVVLTEDGRELEIPTRHFHQGVMRQGDTAWHPVERATLKSLGQLRWEIASPDGLTRCYAPIPGEAAADKDRGMARIVALRDRAGHEVRFSYDERARLSQIVDSAGRTIGLEHDGQSRLRRVWLPAPDGGGLRQHAEYRYDEA